MASNVQESSSSSSSHRRPAKGILKTSISFEKHSSSGVIKNMKFDELNVQQTFHPADKDYGHMKIDEPKTPYNYSDSSEQNEDQLDAELLAEKLRKTIAKSLSINSDDSSDEEQITDEQLQKRREFERRRKLHYNEFEAVRIARELMVRDEDEEEEDDVEFANSNEMDMDVNDGSNSNTTVESVYNKQSTSHF